METSASIQATKYVITSMLDTLSPDSLNAVEQFVRFLHDRQLDLPVAAARYPTKAAPASSLTGWVDMLREGYDGDALADTEALSDEDQP
jgi:hypothetical protein